PMTYTVVGESQAHAEEREQVFLNELVDPTASLALLSELMNHDFSGMALDAPITDELIDSVSGIRGLVHNLRQHVGDTVTHADVGGAQGRHRADVEERQPQQAVRDSRPPSGRWAGAVPPAARDQRCPRRWEPSERIAAVGHRLRIGARAAPAARDGAHHGLRA